MKVAIVHYWLIDRRGGERVIESLCRMYPDADIYTNVYLPSVFEDSPIGQHRVRTTAISSLPGASFRIAEYLPLMPLALAALDLRAYDLVISSESGPAKGVQHGHVPHLCYCHSPMRYIWDMLPLYLESVPTWKRPLMRAAAAWLRHWDVRSARSPHRVVANSRHTQQRIRSYWGREANVLFPPVDTNRFAGLERPAGSGSYYLFAGSLMRYKRPDLAVRACSELGIPLVVAGVGPEFDELRRLAGPTVEFTGWISDDELSLLLVQAKALLHPGEEDFGILPVEAMAAGCPVIAFAGGGVLDSVVNGKTGRLFAEQTVDSLKSVILQHEAQDGGFDRGAITAHARKFDETVFSQQFTTTALALVTEPLAVREQTQA